jgi:hypothetical protein
VTLAGFGTGASLGNGLSTPVLSRGAGEHFAEGDVDFAKSAAGSRTPLFVMAGLVPAMNAFSVPHHAT